MELRAAACRNNVAEVTQLLNDGVDINAADANNETPLLQAVDRGNVEVTQLLLAAGANVVHQNKECKDALMVAKEFNKVQLVPILTAYVEIHDLKTQRADLTSKLQASQETLDKTASELGAKSADLADYQGKVAMLCAEATKNMSTAIQLVSPLSSRGADSL